MKLTVYTIDGITPVVDPTAFVHPSAVLIGDVIVGPGCYIGPVRQPARRLRPARDPRRRQPAGLLRACTAFPGTDTIVEEDGHIGHGAVLHGCIVQRNALVGMNAVVNDNAVIGESAIVAAMAFVKAGIVVPPRTLVAGVPASVVRALTDAGARMEDRGHAELPGAHAALASRRCARRRRSRRRSPIGTQRDLRAAAAKRCVPLRRASSNGYGKAACPVADPASG